MAQLLISSIFHGQSLVVHQKMTHFAGDVFIYQYFSFITKTKGLYNPIQLDVFADYVCFFPSQELKD